MIYDNSAHYCINICIAFVAAPEMMRISVRAIRILFHPGVLSMFTQLSQSAFGPKKPTHLAADDGA